MVKKLFIRLKRYIKFLLQYLLYEKPRGLDFTMRDTTLLKKNEGIYNGHSKTNEKHIQKIFQRVSLDNARLLDVGCGKGVVLKEAVKFPFEKVAGIEIRKELVQIAKNNFKILGIDDAVECIEADAIEFDQYGDYNVFFFFNPFSKEIMQKVVDKIIASRRKMDHIVTVIYHNPQFPMVFEDKTQVLSKEILHDALKDYDTFIYKLKL